MIIIIVLEGKEANTEVNFFRGLSNHLEKTTLRIYPFEKAKNSNKRTQKIVGEIRFIVTEHFNTLQLDGATLFFIGDGDAQKDLKAMKNTKRIIIKYIETNFKQIKIVNEILMEEGLCFEDSYCKMSPEKFFPLNSKKKNYRNLFNVFATKVNWFTNNELDFMKIIKAMKQAKNPHLKIMEMIRKKEQ